MALQILEEEEEPSANTNNCAVGQVCVGGFRSWGIRRRRRDEEDNDEEAPPSGRQCVKSC